MKNNSKEFEIIELPVGSLREAPWNPNQVDAATLERLRISIKKFGMVQNLLVRPHGEEYEVLSGNQRLKVLRDLGVETAPCIIVDLDDSHARLLAQALNHIHGEDDLGLRADLLREVLDKISQEEILKVLPDTAASLSSLSNMGSETMAQYLQKWEQAQAAKLKHLQFQLTREQSAIVEEALSRMMSRSSQVKKSSPNVRGNALYLLCKSYLEEESK